MASWIEKNRSILDFTLSSLLRRKGKNLSLFAVYTLVVFMLGSAMFLTQAMKREASLILKDAPEIVVQRMLGGRYDPIPMDYVEKIREIRGVISAAPRLWGYYYDPVVGANYTLMVPRNGVPPGGQIIIGNGVSRSRMVYRGDILSFRGFDGISRNFTVEGDISPESELVSADLILMAEADFRELFGFRAALATDIVVTVRNQERASHHCPEGGGVAPRYTTDHPGRDGADLRFRFRLAGRHRGRPPDDGAPGLCHFRLGKGVGTQRR